MKGIIFLIRAMHIHPFWGLSRHSADGNSLLAKLQGIVSQRSNKIDQGYIFGMDANKEVLKGRFYFESFTVSTGKN